MIDGKKAKPFETETAYRIYNEYPTSIGNARIKELFGVESSATVCRIKKKIREYMEKNKIKTFYPSQVDTRSAYAVAGLKIEEIENF